MVSKNVKTLICLNDKKNVLKSAFADAVEALYDAKDLEEAVKIASGVSQANEIVLFSPSSKSRCAGENYLSRGTRFRAIVNDIENEHNQ